MTEYFDHCNSRYTSLNFHQFGLDYILENFNSNPNLKDIDVKPEYVKDNGEKIFQKMFDKSKIKMRMYGSPKELMENVKIFTNFPGSDRHFRDLLDPYFTTPMIFRSLSNKKFICKSDLFVMLQSMVVRSMKNQTDDSILLICVYFLKSHEYRFSGIVEFVPFDEEAIDDIWNEIQKISKEVQKSVGERSFQQLMRELSGLSGENLFKKLKSNIPNDWNEFEEERVKQSLLIYEFGLKCFGAQIRLNSKTYLFTQIKVIIRILTQVIDKRPEMFLPNSEIKGKKMTSTVRMFEDGDQKFAMCSELFSALNNEPTSTRHVHLKEPDFMFDAILMEDLFRHYGRFVKNVEFIHYPIQRAKHRAVPIMGVAGKDEEHFCILPIDALFEYLRDMILGHKVFQRHASPYWAPYHDLFIRMQKYFSSDVYPYFIRQNSKTNPDTCPKGDAKDIRGVKADGFTVKDLEDELAYLDLTKTFPEILKHAEVVHAHVDKVKKEKYLRTCDMYDAVEYCQLICVFKRLPNYKKFLHSQRSCGRVPGLECEFCDEKKKEEQEAKNVLKLMDPPTTFSIESNFPVQEISGVESVTVKALAPLGSHKEDLKVEELRASELEEVNLKIASLEEQLVSQSEKSTQLESDLLKATQENELLHLEYIKLQSENEVNKGVMCQLIDKLSINQESPRSIPIVTSSTSLIECILCHIDIFNTQNTVKCSSCRTRFHKSCALNYSKDHEKCPSCKRTIKESAICLN